jgi:hypothetical protein
VGTAGYLARRVEEALQAEPFRLDGIGSEGLAVGSRAFVARFPAEPDMGAPHREIGHDDRYRRHEASAQYSSRFRAERAALSTENRVFLDQFV